ncbi:MAG: AAA family ATPase [[Eubacterium] siraeum]
MTQLIMSFYAGNPVTAGQLRPLAAKPQERTTFRRHQSRQCGNAHGAMISKEYSPQDTRKMVKAYDFVLIDCLPSLGTLLINALTAADRVLIPVQTRSSVWTACSP